MRAEPQVFSRTGRGRIPAAILLAVAMTAAPAPHRPARAATVDALGNRERFVVRGLETLAPEQLLEPLSRDVDVVWLSRPHADRDAFITTVSAKAVAALERAGFAHPRVAAAVESDSGGERLVLDVTEGQRFTAGTVEVTGLPEALAERLSDWLAKPRPPIGARPAAERKGGGATDRWLSAEGFPVEPEPPVWPDAGPAACDAITLHDAHAAVAQFLRDEGYLGIAPVPARRGHARPTADGRRSRTPPVADGAFEVSLRPDGDAMNLVVTVRRLPPRARLREIDIPAVCRTTEAAVAGHLGIVRGAEVTERDRIAWQERLRASARFLRHDVEWRVDPEDPSAVVAAFHLEEYPAVPPLGEPMSREESAMLRCREWICDAIARGEDLVFDVARPKAGPEATGRLVVSPGGGLLLTALPGTPLACGLAAGDASVSLMPPGAHGRLDLPLPAECRVLATLSFALGREKSASSKDVGFRHVLSFQCGLTTRSGLRSGVDIESRIEPVACVALVHEKNPQARFEGDLLVIESGATTCRIDERTGRLIELRVSDGLRLSIDARPEAYAAETTALRDASGPDRLQADAPVTSTLSFLLSDEVAAACGRLIAAAGVDHEQAWSESFATVARIATALRRCLDDGAAASCDRFLVEAAANRSAAGTAEPLVIPSEEESQSSSSAQAGLVRQVAAAAWRLSEQHCGRDSWPAAVVRAGALGLAGDMAVLDEVTQFMLHEDYGPLAHAVASLLSPVQPVSMALARRGRERMSTVAFRTDCHPLLAAVEPYGLDEVCVAVARAVDDDAIRAFGKVVCSDPELLLPLVRSLRTHASHDDAVAGLQTALDACWEQGLKSLVAERLEAVVSPRTAVAPAAGDDRPLKK